MKPRIQVLTLCVDNLDRSLAFYRDGLGLPTKGIGGQEFPNGAVVFFYLQSSLILALWPTDSLIADANVDGVTRSRLGAVTIGHVVSSRTEVDAVMKQAEQAGGTLVEPAKDRFWGGYSGYFHDPDGHLWEIAWNPDIPVSD